MRHLCILLILVGCLVLTVDPAQTQSSNVKALVGGTLIDGYGSMIDGAVCRRNFPLRVVEELRRLGQDVLTAFEDGKANQSVTDQELLARATELD
jgi:hypothetical protein